MTGAASLLIAPICSTARPSAGTPSDPEPSPGPGDLGGLFSEIGTAADNGADLILLPQLSFSPYFPVRRDREALELGERFPSKPMAAARAAAGGAFVAASGYECVGEGVFYVCGELGSEAEGCLLSQRQHRVEATSGRYEQMFFSPGHGDRKVFDAPWGTTGMLIGADVREAGAWAELVRLGASLLLASVSETADLWPGTCRIAAGMASLHGIATGLVNRAPAPDEPDFAGGCLVLDGAGREVAARGDGLFALEIPEPKVMEAS